MERFDEGATIITNLSFTDDVGDPVVPDKIDYAVTDILSGTELVACTEVTPVTNPYRLVLPVSASDIVNSELLGEQHEILVKSTLSGNEIGVEVVKVYIAKVLGCKL